MEGKKAYKEVIWFLGKVSDASDGKVSSEHEELVWLPFEEAVKRVTHNPEKEFLKKTEQRVNTI